MSGCADDEDDAEPLTCEVLASNNCWRQAVAEAALCVPASEEQGMFSADLTSCTYADGALVTFEEPAQVPQEDDVVWDFTVSTPDGEPCLSFYDDADSGSGTVALTTARGTVTEIVSGTTLTLICPEGDAYRGSGLSLLECEDVFTSLPGYVTSWSDSFLSFGLAGTGDAVQDVFACER